MIQVLPPLQQPNGPSLVSQVGRPATTTLRFGAETAEAQPATQPLWKTALEYCPAVIKNWVASWIEMAQNWLHTLKQTVLGPLAPGEKRSLFKTRFLELYETLNKDSGHPWMVATRPGVVQGGVVVIPVTRNNELILIEQHRPALQKTCIEFPAGLIGDSKAHESEAALDTAPRELTEETGYNAKKLTYLGFAATTPGMTDELAHYVKAEDLTKVTDQLGVDGENIQNVHLIPLDKIDQWLTQKQKEGFVINSAVFSGLGLIRGQQTP